ncbi:hypothetical protein TWF694_006267 [Orbilia ellipsospora]|uniref:Uncharacterized protein n=1 Tax=Orbilia ellipsospora TaxID=2528407 RepID=A0AAV9XL31_9PEZI
MSSEIQEEQAEQQRPERPSTPLNPVFAPVVTQPRDPKERLPGLERCLKTYPAVQHPNINALINDIKAERKIWGFYQNGQGIEWDDINRKMFYWASSFSALISSTVYPPSALIRNEQMQEILLQIRLDEELLGPIDASYIFQTTVNDCGSSALTLNNADLTGLNIPPHYYNNFFEVELETAMGRKITESFPVECQLWTADGHHAVGEWFRENAVIITPDVPHLTGCGFRRHLWGVHGPTGRAGFAVKKTSLRGTLPFL